MPTYFITENVTREGMMTIKDAPKRAQGVVAFASGFGVKIVEWFNALGEFDFIMKVEAPDDHAISAFAMALRKSGNVTVQVSRAFTPDEWAGMIDRIPD